MSFLHKSFKTTESGQYSAKKTPWYHVFKVPFILDCGLMFLYHWKDTGPPKSMRIKVNDSAHGMFCLICQWHSVPIIMCHSVSIIMCHSVSIIRCHSVPIIMCHYVPFSAILCQLWWFVANATEFFNNHTNFVGEWVSCRILHHLDSHYVLM